MLFCCKICSFCNLRCFVQKYVFVAIYALLRGEKLSQKLYPWRKNDKEKVCAWRPAFICIMDFESHSGRVFILWLWFLHCDGLLGQQCWPKWLSRARSPQNGIFHLSERERENSRKSRLFISLWRHDFKEMFNSGRKWTGNLELMIYIKMCKIILRFL